MGRSGRGLSNAGPATGAACALAAALALTPAPALGAEPAAPDWPCVQRLVPKLAAGTVWAGPPLGEAARAWRDDAAVRDVVRLAAARGTTLEQADRAIAGLAAGLGADRPRRLTLVFAGLLETIDDERARVIDGILSYAGRQRRLAERIARSVEAIEAAAGSETAAGQEELRALRERHAWDVRIFTERERSLVYLCEQPVLLEQRLFALARAIQALLQ